MTQPCKDCEKRWIDEETATTCHNTCKDYAEFLVEIEERRKRVQAQRHTFVSENEFKKRIRAVKASQRQRGMR